MVKENNPKGPQSTRYRRVVRIGLMLAVALPSLCFLFPTFGEALRLGAWAIQDSVETMIHRSKAARRVREQKRAETQAQEARRIEGSLTGLFSRDVRTLAHWGEKILVAGFHYPGIAIARLDQLGRLDRAFTDRVTDETFKHVLHSGYTNRMVVSPEGSFAILIGSFGKFSALKLLRDGQVDRAFLDALDYFNDASQVSDAAVLTSGDVVLTGHFGHRRSPRELPQQWRLIYLTRQNHLVPHWLQDDFEILQSNSFLVVDRQGSLVLQSSLKGRNTNGSAPPFHLARIMANGSWDKAFIEKKRYVPLGKIVPLPDGNYVAIGIVSGQVCTAQNEPSWGDCVGNYSPTEKTAITILNSTGTVIKTLETWPCVVSERGVIADAALDRSGRLIVAGHVPTGDGSLRQTDQQNTRGFSNDRPKHPQTCLTTRLVRIDIKDAAIDQTFSDRFSSKGFPMPTTDPQSLPIRAVLPMSDGTLVIGGCFTHIEGQPRRHIARLNSSGGVIEK